MEFGLGADIPVGVVVAVRVRGAAAIVAGAVVVALQFPQLLADPSKDSRYLVRVSR